MYTLTERSIKEFNYDVIVIGGGPAGCAAAAAAAREGSHTLIVEASGSLGGMGTIGLVPSWCPFSDEEKVIYKGLAERIFWEAREGIPHLKNKDLLDWVPIDAEILKRVYDNLMIEFGVDVLFNTMVAAVDTDDNKITAVMAANKNGISAFKAKIFIDCSGDADLVAWSGGEFLVGDDNGAVQASTHCFTLSNVDEYNFNNGEILHANNKNCAIHEIIKDEKYTLINDDHICASFIAPRTIGFNAGHIFDVSSENMLDFSKALMLGRKMANEYRKALSDYVPEVYASSYVSQTAPAFGVRESRRIVGDYTLTYKDFLNMASFEDEIGRNCYFIDVHSSKGAEALENVAVEKTVYNKGESHGIPYRCLTPKGLKNVLVAGRSISADKIMQASIRVMPVCLVTGEAAGVAAGIAAKKEDINVHNLDVSNIRKILLKNGGYFFGEE